MSLWQGKSKGTKGGYSIFVWILKKLGVFPAYFLLRFVTVYYFLFSIRSSRAIYYYFHNRLRYSRHSSIFKIYSNYFLFGQSLIDKVVIMSGIPNPFTFNFDGEENLRKIIAMGKGGILLSAHIGSWEAAGHLLKRLNTRINIVMYDGEQQKIKEYLNTVLGERNLNINIIIIRDHISHIYEINEAFNKNELICMHADRFLEGNRTVPFNFLGEDALFPLGPFLLAAQFKVPVSFVFSLKETPSHYHFFASEVKEYADVSKKINIQNIVADYVREMEKKVKSYPLQWYNYYNFWQSNA